MRIGWRDVAVPAALLFVGVVELALLGTSGWPAAAGLEAVAALSLVLRRSHPVVVAPVASLALTAIPWTGTRMDEPATPIIFYILAIYSLGRYARHRLGGLVGLALLLLLVFADLLFVSSDDSDATDVMFVMALAVPPYVFGRVSRRLAEQTALVARQSEQLRDQAVREERDRIARELHDVIAHSVSAMVVQTAAAQDLVRTDPDGAAGALENVARTGREALAETGRLLHLVRDEDDELGLAPAPGLADLAGLVDSHRDRGMDLQAELRLPDRPVSGGVDVSAYRVVQEALTNAVRHGAGTTTLTVASEAGALRIACCNGLGPATEGGSGLGLTGMAERVRMLGGSLTQGRTGDRFELHVTLPLEPQP